jgi:hypothetical protein
MINAFKFDKLDAAGLEPALVEMERLNATAARLAGEHGARAATDVTGFGLVGHALNVARGSGVSIEVRYDALPVHEAFYPLAKSGVSTGCTEANAEAAAPFFTDRRGLAAGERELLFDPQTSGGLLLSVPAEAAGRSSTPCWRAATGRRRSARWAPGRPGSPSSDPGRRRTGRRPATGPPPPGRAPAARGCRSALPPAGRSPPPPPRATRLRRAS